MKAALEKRAVDAESQLDTVNDELVTCTLEKQQAETKQKEVAKKSLEDTTILKEQLAEAKQAAIKSEKAAKKAAEKSQGELKQSRDEAKKAAGKLQAALTQSQDEVTRMKKAADELKAKAEETATALQAKLKQSQADTALAIKKSQAEAAAKLQGLQAAVCTEIAQVESERAEAVRVEKEVAEKAKQAALLQMDTAMKEITSSCLPEAPVDVVYKQESEKLNEDSWTWSIEEFNDASPQDKLFYEAKNIEDVVEPVILEVANTEDLTKDQLSLYTSNISNAALPSGPESADALGFQVDARQKQEAFEVTKLDQRQDSKQNESEEELKRASEKVLSYVPKNTAEEQYVQIARQDVIGRDQDGLAAKFAEVNVRETCSAATQKFMELARAYMSVSAIVPGVNPVTYRGELTDSIGREQEFIKDQVIELEPVNDIGLSSLASIVGCGAVKKQQALPFVSEEDASEEVYNFQPSNLAATGDANTNDGNFDFGVP